MGEPVRAEAAGETDGKYRVKVTHWSSGASLFTYLFVTKYLAIKISVVEHLHAGPPLTTTRLRNSFVSQTTRLLNSSVSQFISQSQWTVVSLV